MLGEDIPQQGTDCTKAERAKLVDKIKMIPRFTRDDSSLWQETKRFISLSGCKFQLERDKTEAEKPQSQISIIALKVCLDLKVIY